MSFVDFDSIFNPPPPYWENTKIAKNSPCNTCEHSLRFKGIYPGSEYSPKQCDGCVQRLQWVIDCLQKLAWYEEKEKEQ